MSTVQIAHALCMSYWYKLVNLQIITTDEFARVCNLNCCVQVYVTGQVIILLYFYLFL